MADMLNSSRDTSLEPEQSFSLVLKLAVATVLTAAAVAEGSDTAEILYTVQWNHRTFSYFKVYLCIFYPCLISEIMLKLTSDGPLSCSRHNCNFLLSCTQTMQFLLNQTDNFI